MDEMLYVDIARYFLIQGSVSTDIEEIIRENKVVDDELCSRTKRVVAMLRQSGIAPTPAIICPENGKRLRKREDVNQ